MQKFDYKLVFENIESSVIKTTGLSKKKFKNKLEAYIEKNLGDYLKKTDQEICWNLLLVTWHGGVKAGQIEKIEDKIKKQLFYGDYKKLSTLTEEKKRKIVTYLKYPNRCDWSFRNATIFNDIINEFGSFNNYLYSLGIENKKITDNQLNIIKYSILDRFKHGSLGIIKVYHFLMDLGFNIVKPDMVNCRTLERLDLLDNKIRINNKGKEILNCDYDGVVREARNFASASGNSIRYVDLILIKFGQDKKSYLFDTIGICLKKPHCELCEIQEYCKYFNEKN